MVKDIRKTDSPESVSMRDVKRCRTLIQWFKHNLKNPKNNENKDRRTAIVLGLAHSYHSRLWKLQFRKEYCGISPFIYFFPLENKTEKQNNKRKKSKLMFN